MRDLALNLNNVAHHRLECMQKLREGDCATGECMRGKACLVLTTNQS